MYSNKKMHSYNNECIDTRKKCVITRKKYIMIVQCNYYIMIVIILHLLIIVSRLTFIKIKLYRTAAWLKYLDFKYFEILKKNLRTVLLYVPQQYSMQRSCIFFYTLVEVGYPLNSLLLCKSLRYIFILTLALQMFTFYSMGVRCLQ